MARTCLKIREKGAVIRIIVCRENITAKKI